MLLAGGVCVWHCADLSGFAALSWIPTVISSKMLVRAFFVVSGFLIVMSFERSSSFTSYLNKRSRRIYPAYLTVVVLSAVLLSMLSSLTASEYFSSLAWWRYLLANLSFLNFLQPTLPGVFAANVEPFVNGSLWTIKIEVMFYLTVPVLVYVIRRFSALPVLAIVYVLSVAYAVVLLSMAKAQGSAGLKELSHQLPGQLAYFVAGAFFYYYLPVLERYRNRFLLPAIAVLIANLFYPLPWLMPFALATVVIVFALFRYWGNFGRYGDFSYGLYILHFPIVQALLTFPYFKTQPYLFLFSACGLSLVGAFLSWHCIEKRWLQRGKTHGANDAPSSRLASA